MDANNLDLNATSPWGTGNLNRMHIRWSFQPSPHAFEIHSPLMSYFRWILNFQYFL